MNKFNKIPRLGRSLVTMEIISLPGFEQGSNPAALMALPDFQLSGNIDEVKRKSGKKTRTSPSPIVEQSDSTDLLASGVIANVSGASSHDHHDIGTVVTVTENQFHTPCTGNAADTHATHGTHATHATHINNMIVVQRNREVQCPFPSYTLAFCMAMIACPQLSLFLNHGRTFLMKEIKKVFEELGLSLLTDAAFAEEEGIIHATCITMGCRIIVIELKFRSICVFGDDNLPQAAVLVAHPVMKRKYVKYSVRLLGEEADCTTRPYDESLRIAHEVMSCQDS